MIYLKLNQNIIDMKKFTALVISTLICVSFSFAQQFAWTQKASLPGFSRHSGIGFAIGLYGYLATGYDNGSCYNDMWRYDQQNNSWTQVASMPGNARYGASAFTINNRAYAGIGLNSSNQSLSDFYEYDPSVNSWISKAVYFGPPVYTAVSFSVNILGYLATGYPLSKRVYQLDTIAMVAQLCKIRCCRC